MSSDVIHNRELYVVGLKEGGMLPLDVKGLGHWRSLEYDVTKWRAGHVCLHDVT